MRARFGTRHGLTCLLGGTALTLALAAPGAARSGPNIPCGPPAAHTLASDGLARVYSQHKRVYGCAAAGEKSFRLGQASGTVDHRRVGPIALAGVDAAYGVTTSGVDTVSADVAVTRLTDGHVVHRCNAITGNLPAEYYEHVAAVVVKSDGSVAWTADVGSIPSQGRPERQVEKTDRTGQALLDHGPGIRLRSLQLRGSKLTWRDGTATRSATLH